MSEKLLTVENKPLADAKQVDDPSAFGSKEGEEANATPWTEKHIRESKPFIARAFKRISEAGY